MIIRLFRAADADSLSELFHASVHEIGVRDYSLEQVNAWSPTKPEPKRYIAQAANSIFLVAEDEDGQLAGYGNLEQNGHIDQLYCRPDRVASGIGSSLYAAPEKSAKEAEMTVLFVEASEGARRFFERRGFYVDARNDFSRAGVMLHNYRMRKCIG